MMSRDEFEKTVRAMRAEGVPLTMPNLMLRTELPRSTIEEWLEDLEQSERRPSAKAAAKPSPKTAVKDKDDDEGAPNILNRMNDLKNEIVKNAATAAVKEKLGIPDDEEDEDDDHIHGSARARDLKDLRWGAGLGLVAGPLGLFYSAPYQVAGVASAIYLAGIFLLRLVPVVGSAFLAYLIPLIHIGCAVAGAAYTWRYNRTGRRSALMPASSSSRLDRRR